MPSGGAWSPRLRHRPGLAGRERAKPGQHGPRGEKKHPWPATGSGRAVIVTSPSRQHLQETVEPDGGFRKSIHRCPNGSTIPHRRPRAVRRLVGRGFPLDRQAPPETAGRFGGPVPRLFDGPPRWQGKMAWKGSRGSRGRARTGTRARAREGSRSISTAGRRGAGSRPVADRCPVGRLERAAHRGAGRRIPRNVPGPWGARRAVGPRNDCRGGQRLRQAGGLALELDAAGSACCGMFLWGCDRDCPFPSTHPAAPRRSRRRGIERRDGLEAATPNGSVHREPSSPSVCYGGNAGGAPPSSASWAVWPRWVRWQGHSGTGQPVEV